MAGWARPSPTRPGRGSATSPWWPRARWPSSTPTTAGRSPHLTARLGHPARDAGAAARAAGVTRPELPSGPARGGCRSMSDEATVPELIHPDGVMAPDQSSTGLAARETTAPPRPTRRRDRVRVRAGQGHAGRLDDQAAARRGAHHPARRAGPRAAARRSTRPRSPSSARPCSPDLRDELDRLALPFDGEALPSEVELRLAQAQLVGWLEGLFHGIQATLFAQQMAARQQLENMRGQLPPGLSERPDERPGTYL